MSDSMRPKHDDPEWDEPEEIARIPEFLEIMAKSVQIHKKKNADYASADDPFSNFKFSSMLMESFHQPIDKAFVSLIATKLARIAELSGNGKIPNNESLDDSFLDLVTYCGLWAAYRKRYK
jgi:hypothetical protein